jgi:hypothetical protein
VKKELHLIKFSEIKKVLIGLKKIKLDFHLLQKEHFIIEKEFAELERLIFIILMVCFDINFIL